MKMPIVAIVATGLMLLAISSNALEVKRIDRSVAADHSASVVREKAEGPKRCKRGVPFFEGIMKHKAPREATMKGGGSAMSVVRKGWKKR